MSKRKPTYEQALALERGQAAARASARRRGQAPTLEPEKTAEWEAKRKKALAAYRARKAQS